MPINKLNDRRRFLKHLAGLTAAGSASSIFPQLDMLSALSASKQKGPDDYKALVCLELNGGADSFNILTPRDAAVDSHYGNYVASRGGVYSNQNPIGRALGFDDLLPINAPAGSGIETTGSYGLHPECRDHGVSPGLASLYDNNELAFVANVGALTTPITKTEFENRSKPFPKGASGHANGLIYWKNGRDDPFHKNGWGGAIAANLTDGPSTGTVPLPPTVSLSGNNLFQVGRYSSNNQPLQPYALSIQGSPLLTSPIYATNSAAERAHRDSLEEILNLTYNNKINNELQSILSTTNGLNASMNDLLMQGNGSTDPNEAWSRIETPYQTSGVFDPINNSYPAGVVNVNGVGYSNLLLSKFRTIAQIIKLSRDPRAGINARRQVFFVSLPGFDMHFAQMDIPQPVTTALFSQALGYFSQALKEIGAFNQVTTFSISEFGRTLTPNTGGTDHAWGGNHFMMGGAVNGGKIYGKYPRMLLNANNDAEKDWSFQRGEYLPSTGIEQYAAALGAWMGVSPSELNVIFPNLSNFDALNFMQS